MLKVLKVLAFVGVLASSSGIATADVITFVPGNYDNTANTVIAGPTPVNNQTTGLFRDVFWYSLNNAAPRVESPDFINSGNSLTLQSNHAAPGPGPIQALNFTGPSVSGGQSYLSIYDTTPANGIITRNLFDAAQGLQISADVLFVKHNTSGGVVALYSQGQDGLALLANNRDGNNTDIPTVSLIFKSPGQGITLATATLPSGSFCTATDGGVGCTAGDHWYRVVMDLKVTGDAFAVTGTFFNHLTPADPNSALGSLISTLSFTGSLLNSDPTSLALTNPGEIGLMAMGDESISLPDNVGISITNFTFPTKKIPEPSSLALLGFGLVGLGVIRLRRRAA